MRAILVLTLAVLAGCAGLSLPGGGGATGPFSARTFTDTETGWEVIVLRYAGDGQGGGKLEARIAPEAGGNLFSLRADDLELLRQPERMADLGLHRSGTPILYPTPNRVRGGRMTFEERVFNFRPNSGGNFIHGLVRSLPWQSAPSVASDSGASVSVWVDWDERQAEFASFPIRHRLTVTYTLHDDGIRTAYAVENRDQARLPFGFGLHPWFRVPGSRQDVFLQVPAAYRMEAEEKLPTGRLLPVAGTPFDLRQPTPLEGLNLDDVYIGLDPSSRPAFELRDRGVRVVLTGSREFTHMVVYTPPNQPFFCLENQTSSTDAHNLWERGLREESHLQVVSPGETARGFVDWKVERADRD